MRTFSIALVLLAAAVTASAQEHPAIAVSQTDGDYLVSARFLIDHPSDVVREVLTDYPNIPRFMPDVRTSIVLERGERRARVEQEAVSKLMLFSKTIHLVLDVDEGDQAITFRDRCGRSFRHYEGSWTLRSHGDRTELTYTLVARPAFAVPGFVLRKLLNRDAVAMVDRLRTEIHTRAAAR
jgi:uncharacterized membrane protein